MEKNAPEEIKSYSLRMDRKTLSQIVILKFILRLNAIPIGNQMDFLKNFSKFIPNFCGEFHELRTAETPLKEKNKVWAYQDLLQIHIK